MSSNVVKEKIIELLSSIVNESKSETLLLSETQDLLLQLQNIFNGLQLFIDSIQSKNSFENKKIKAFLARNLESFSLFPSLYNFIKAQHLDVQESIVLKETKSSESEQDSYKDITDELKEELKLGGGLRNRVEIANEESEITKAQLRKEMGIMLGNPRRSESTTSKPPHLPDLLDLPGESSSSDKSTLPPLKSAPTSIFATNPPSSPASKPMTKKIFNPPSNPKPQPKTTSKIIQEVDEKAKKYKGKENSQKMSLNQEKDLLSKELKEILLDESKRSILIDYYSRMNINQVYDFTIKVDKKELQAKKIQKDFLTGEQQEQITDEITVVEDQPIEIELNVPGCLVTPSIQYVSPKAQTSQVTFYVTPYAKFSKRSAKVVIGQKRLDRKTIPLQVKVIDRRLFKIFSVLGLLIASIPSIWPYIVGPDLNQQIFLTLSNYSTSITNELIVPIEVGLGGFITLFSFLWFKLYSSKRSSFNQSI